MQDAAAATLKHVAAPWDTLFHSPQLFAQNALAFDSYLCYVWMQDALEATLKKWSGRENQYIRIDGSTPPAERTGLVSVNVFGPGKANKPTSTSIFVNLVPRSCVFLLCCWLTSLSFLSSSTSPCHAPLRALNGAITHAILVDFYSLPCKPAFF
jgi:hypothetical protein